MQKYRGRSLYLKVKLESGSVRSVMASSSLDVIDNQNVLLVILIRSFVLWNEPEHSWTNNFLFLSIISNAKPGNMIRSLFQDFRFYCNNKFLQKNRTSFRIKVIWSWIVKFNQGAVGRDELSRGGLKGSKVSRKEKWISLLKLTIEFLILVFWDYFKLTKTVFNLFIILSKPLDLEASLHQQRK